MLDLVIFVAALVVVAVVSVWVSRGERTRDQYFLAGRKLTWWLIGFSVKTHFSAVSAFLQYLQKYDARLWRATGPNQCTSVSILENCKDTLKEQER